MTSYERQEYRERLDQLLEKIDQLTETVSQQAHDLTLHVQRERELLKLLETECTCRWIEMCDRCEAIDDYRAKGRQ